jgi:hypothetical protein
VKRAVAALALAKTSATFPFDGTLVARIPGGL